MEHRNLLGVADAEALTGVSRWTWRRWAYDGKVGSVKLGKRLLIPSAEISRLVEENTRPRLADVREGRSAKA
jgi:excisionase family DNA binding protein